MQFPIRTLLMGGLSLCLSLPGTANELPGSAAGMLIADGHYRRAQQLVRAALEQHPQDVAALIDLSTIQFAFGQLDASLATAEKAVQADDGSAATHAQLVNALGAKLASPKLGMMEKMSTARRFHKETELTLKLDPKNLYALEAVSRFYWYAPSVGGGDKSKALQNVNQLIQLDTVRGYALKAELDATSSDKTRAAAAVHDDWKQAVALQPESYIAHLGLGKTLLDTSSDHGTEKLAAVEAEAKKAFSINPGRIAAYRLLAASYVLALRFDDLNGALAQARGAVPDDLGARYTAADAMLSHNMQAQMPMAEKYLLEYLGQPPEGLEPSHAMAHWRLGLVLEKEGRQADAIRELETAITLDPSLDGAKKDLKRLR